MNTPKMRKVKLEEATPSEMLLHCRVVLGMGKAILPDHTGADTLRAKILALMPDTQEIEVPEVQVVHDKPVGHGGNPGISERAQGVPTSSHGGNDPKVSLTLFKTEKNKGEPIPVSVNGRTMLIPVGSLVSIPYRYFLALNYAVTTQYNFDDKTNDITPSEEPRHQYNVSEMPSRDEIAAWNEALTNEKRAPNPVDQKAA